MMPFSFRLAFNTHARLGDNSPMRDIRQRFQKSRTTSKMQTRDDRIIRKLHRINPDDAAKSGVRTYHMAIGIMPHNTNIREAGQRPPAIIRKSRLRFAQTIALDEIKRATQHRRNR